MRVFLRTERVLKGFKCVQYSGERSVQSTEGFAVKHLWLRLPLFIGLKQIETICKKFVKRVDNCFNDRLHFTEFCRTKVFVVRFAVFLKDAFVA